MELKKLTVKNLFGHFNHTIPFNENNITIITAPNGYGKTMVLKIIDAFFNKKFSYFSNLQFDTIEFTMESDSYYVKKEHMDDKNFKITSDLFKNIFSYNINDASGKRSVLLEEINNLPFIHRLSPDQWLDIRTDEIHDFESIIENFPEHIRKNSLNMVRNIPDWYNEACNRVNAHFIQDQRLILKKVESLHRRSEQRFINTIESYAEDLVEKFKEASLDSQKISQKLDTSFPERLLAKTSDFEVMTVEQIKEELKKLQSKRERLIKYSLSPSESHLPSIFEEIGSEDKKVLTLYIKDTESKLKAYEPILNKIELFFSILNTKRLSFKEVRVDQNNGFGFYTSEDQPLKLTQLSSGEQHQVVLLYELIFKTKPNLLVLIDEPEISLHIAWQKEFLKDLKAIIELHNMPVVIATHSPQIIDDNWHLTVDLEEGAFA